MTHHNSNSALQRVDADARAAFGVAFAECSWAQVEHLAAAARNEAATALADIDRMKAALAEADACGCTTFTAPRVHGVVDAGRVRVEHVCGTTTTRLNREV